MFAVKTKKEKKKKKKKMGNKASKNKSLRGDTGIKRRLLPHKQEEYIPQVICDFPYEILLEIAKFIPVKELVNSFMLVNKKDFYNLSCQDMFWRELMRSNYPYTTLAHIRNRLFFDNEMRLSTIASLSWVLKKSVVGIWNYIFKINYILFKAELGEFEEYLQNPNFLKMVPLTNRNRNKKLYFGLNLNYFDEDIFTKKNFKFIIWSRKKEEFGIFIRVVIQLKNLDRYTFLFQRGFTSKDREKSKPFVLSLIKNYSWEQCKTFFHHLYTCYNDWDLFLFEALKNINTNGSIRDEIVTNSAVINNEHLFFYMFKNDITKFEFIGDSLKGNKAFILRCANKSYNKRIGELDSYLAPEILNDKDFMLSLIKINYNYSIYVRAELCSDEEFVRKIYKVNSNCMDYFSSKITEENKKVVSKYIKRWEIKEGINAVLICCLGLPIGICCLCSAPCSIPFSLIVQKIVKKWPNERLELCSNGWVCASVIVPCAPCLYR
jgi:hypothetical protein